MSFNDKGLSRRIKLEITFFLNVGALDKNYDYYYMSFLYRSEGEKKKV